MAVGAAPGSRDDRYIPAAIKARVRARDGGKCRNCGSTDGLQFDHIYPWSKGGTSKSADNIQLLCASCNLRKGASLAGTGKHRSDALELKSDSLIGSFFHGDGEGGTQGQVVAEPTPGIYLVEFFSWMDGSPCWQKLIKIDQMTGWRFYDSSEWMVNNYEAGAYPWRKKELEEERQEQLESRVG